MAKKNLAITFTRGDTVTLKDGRKAAVLIPRIDNQTGAESYWLGVEGAQAESLHELSEIVLPEPEASPT